LDNVINSFLIQLPKQASDHNNLLLNINKLTS